MDLWALTVFAAVGGVLVAVALIAVDDWYDRRKRRRCPQSNA
jgi:hypothetical protein